MLPMAMMTTCSAVHTSLQSDGFSADRFAAITRRRIHPRSVAKAHSTLSTQRANSTHMHGFDSRSDRPSAWRPPPAQQLAAIACRTSWQGRHPLSHVAHRAPLAALASSVIERRPRLHVSLLRLLVLPSGDGEVFRSVSCSTHPCRSLDHLTRCSLTCPPLPCASPQTARWALRHLCAAHSEKAAAVRPARRTAADVLRRGQAAQVLPAPAEEGGIRRRSIDDWRRRCRRRS